MPNLQQLPVPRRFCLLYNSGMPSDVDPFIRSIADLDFTPRQPVYPSPDDWRDVVIYEIMIDRFDDGRDRPPYDGTSRGNPHDPEVYQHFQGGTLNGITRRLDYIQGLGISAIWITPPFKQMAHDDVSYHGYAIQDFLRIDPRFGTTEDLRRLVAEAHRRQIAVLLDVVFDHAGDVFAYKKPEARVWHRGKRFNFGHWRRGDGSGEPAGDNPGPDDAIWPVELQTPDAFFRMGAMRDTGTAKGLEATRGDFFASKGLDLTEPGVVSVMIDIFKYWIAVTDIDGFRIDAFRHIELDAGRHFCHAIREYARSIGKRNFMLLGEIVTDDASVAPYTGSNAPAADEKGVTRRALLDCVFDFPLHDALCKTFAEKKSPAVISRHWDFLHRYFRDHAEAGKHYVRFFENHDFGSGHHRRLLHNDPDSDLGIAVAAFVLLSQGIPCLYYGSEQGFDGGGDNDRYVRECMFGGNLGAFGTTAMHFFNPDHRIYRAIARLAAVRRDQPVIRYGRQYFRRTSADGETFTHPDTGDSVLAFSRVLDVRQLVVAINLSQKTRSDWIETDARLWPAGKTVRDLLGDTGTRVVEAVAQQATKVRVTLPPRGVAVLALESA